MQMIGIKWSISLSFENSNKKKIKNIKSTFKLIWSFKSCQTNHTNAMLKYSNKFDWISTKILLQKRNNMVSWTMARCCTCNGTSCSTCVPYSLKLQQDFSVDKNRHFSILVGISCSTYYTRTSKITFFKWIFFI